MTVNEDLQQAYMMLLSSKAHLMNASYSWRLKERTIKDLCDEISGMQDKIFDLVHYFDEDEDLERNHKEEE